jgi:hypothetical protein
VPTTTGIKLKEDVLKYASSTGTGETVPLTMQSPTGEVQFTGEGAIVLFLAGLLQTAHVFCRCMVFLLGIMYVCCSCVDFVIICRFYPKFIFGTSIYPMHQLM